MKKKTATQKNSASESISCSLPGWLVEMLDHTCEQIDIPRSVAIKKAIKRWILSKMDHPANWEKLYQDMQNGS